MLRILIIKRKIKDIEKVKINIETRIARWWLVQVAIELGLKIDVKSNKNWYGLPILTLEINWYQKCT